MLTLPLTAKRASSWRLLVLALLACLSWPAVAWNAAGHRLVAVRRLPRIALIDSGDELASDPTACAVHQIPASNGVMLAALAASALPCTVTRLGPVADTMAALARALDQTGDVDVVVTSGGASVGDHDLIRPALAAWGAELDFWKVAIKPGKPIMVARRGQVEAAGRR